MTGKGTPYFTPAWPFKTIGMVIIKFAKPIMINASDQFSPVLIIYEANKYVGIQTAIPTQIAAKCHLLQVLLSSGTGARSSLYKGEFEISSCNSIMSLFILFFMLEH